MKMHQGSFSFYPVRRKNVWYRLMGGGGWDPSEPIVVGGLGLGEEGPKPPLERKAGISFPSPEREASLKHY